MKLILASSSKYRRALLEKNGIPIMSQSPLVDEELLKSQLTAEGLTPKAFALKLAEAKAKSVLEVHRDAIVIGGDQVCVFDGKITHKPLNRENNIALLKKKQGQIHYLFTCICIVSSSQQVLFSDTTELHMKKLSDADIEKYVDLDQPFDCAGGYKYESHGHTLFEKVNTEDITAIEGLPLKQTLQILKKDFGVRF